MKTKYLLIATIISLGTFFLLNPGNPSTPNPQKQRFRGSGSVGGASQMSRPSYQPNFDMKNEKTWGWLDLLNEARTGYEQQMAEHMEKWKDIRGINPQEWYTQALHDLDSTPLAQQTSIGGLPTDEYYKNRDKLLVDQNELIRLQTMMRNELRVIEQNESEKSRWALGMSPPRQ